MEVVELNDIGKRIRSLRQRRGFSQEQLGAVFFASTFWKKGKQKWRKVNLQNEESCRNSLLIVTKGSKNWIPVRPALHLSRGLRGISSPVPGFGIPRSF